MSLFLILLLNSYRIENMNRTYAATPHIELKVRITLRDAGGEIGTFGNICNKTKVCKAPYLPILGEPGLKVPQNLRDLGGRGAVRDIFRNISPAIIPCANTPSTIWQSLDSPMQLVALVHLLPCVGHYLLRGILVVQLPFYIFQ